MAMNMTTFDFSFVSNYYYYFLLFISLLLISNFFSKRSTTKNKPPSPPAFPIIGHLYLIKNKPLPEVLIDLSDRYGHVLLLRLGSQSVLTLSSPSSVEECLTKNDMIFANRPHAVVARHLGYDSKTVEWVSYGSDWRNLRRVMNMDIFSYSSLQKTCNIRNQEVQYMLHQLYQRSLSSSSTEIFHEVDLRAIFFEFAFNMIMKIVSGKRSYNGSKKWSFDRLITESFLPERLIHMVDLFPVLRWIGYQSTEKKLKQGRKNKDVFLDELIQEYLDTSSSASGMAFRECLDKWIWQGGGGCPASGMAFRAISLAIGGLVQCLEWKGVDHDDEVIEEGEEPSPRAVCRPRLVKKDILSQI